MVSGRFLVTLTTFAALGSGVVGGVFFAFSVFVMKALDRLPPAQSITAMQAINEAAPTAWFMLALIGTAAACVALAVAAVASWGDPGAVHVLAGSLLYLVAIGLTGGYHVPRNNALATVDPATVDTLHRWTTYSTGWTAWNHARTITSIAAATLFVLALRAG
jgi:uncharacterized membrane protein